MYQTEKLINDRMAAISRSFEVRSNFACVDQAPTSESVGTR